MIPRNFLQPIHKITTGRIGTTDGQSYIVGQILRGNLLVVDISMNECDYESWGVVRYVVYVAKLIPVQNKGDRILSEYTIGNIIKQQGKDTFVGDKEGSHIKDNIMFSLFSFEGIPVFKEHEIPKD